MQLHPKIPIEYNIYTNVLPKRMNLFTRELRKLHYLEERFTSIKVAVARPPDIELTAFGID